MKKEEGGRALCECVAINLVFAGAVSLARALFRSVVCAACVYSFAPLRQSAAARAAGLGVRSVRATGSWVSFPLMLGCGMEGWKVRRMKGHALDLQKSI